MADLDPLEINSATIDAEDEEEMRSKLLATYKYHTLYNLGETVCSNLYFFSFANKRIF